MTSRFQFSIRFLLVATAAIGGVVAAVVARPSWRSSLALGCLSLLLSTAGVVAARRTDGPLQLFWIGTAAVLALGPIFAASFGAWLAIIWNTPLGYEQAIGGTALDQYVWGARVLRVVLPAIWCAAPINGLVAVFLNWLFAPRRNAP